MSFEPREYLLHILVEADHPAQGSSPAAAGPLALNKESAEMNHEENVEAILGRLRDLLPDLRDRILREAIPV